MDGSRFDMFTRNVAGLSRRSLIKTTVGAVAAVLLGGVTGASAGASKKRAGGQTCRTSSECESLHTCDIGADGRRRCSTCRKNSCNQCVETDSCLDNSRMTCNSDANCALAETIDCGTYCVTQTCSDIACTSSSDCELGSYCVRRPGCCGGNPEGFFCARNCDIEGGVIS